MTPHDDRAAGEIDFELDPSLSARTPQILEAIAYWTKKRGKRFAPSRNEIQPQDLKTILPHVQLFDVLDGGRAYRPRLVGSGIVEAIGENPVGQIFDQTNSRPIVRRVLQAIGYVVSERRPLRTFTRRSAMEGRDFLSHETVFLPLSNDGVTIDMMLVVGVFTPSVKASAKSA